MPDTSDITVIIPTDDPQNPAEYTYSEAVQLIQDQIAKAEYKSAAAISQTVAKKLPDDQVVQVLAARALLLNHEPEAALPFAKQAAALDQARHLTPRILLSRIALALGDQTGAKEQVENLIAQEPKNDAAYLEQGDQRTAIGDLEGAQSSYLTALELNSRNSVALLNLSNLPEAKAPAKLLKKFEFLISSGQLAGGDKIYGHYALANFYQKQKDYAAHFRHLNAGSAILCNFHQYQPQAHREITRGMMEHFSASFFKKFSPLSHNTRKLIFIVGMPRSGSTLVEQILCSHSQVGDAGENPYLINAVNRFGRLEAEGATYPHSITSETYPKLHLIAQDYLQSINKVSDAPYVTDKTLGNYNLIGLMHLLFPKAHFVHIRRNPVATCYGCYQRLFTEGNLIYSYSQEHLAETYRDYHTLMSHWDSVLPDRVHTVDYEDLVQNQEKVTRQLLAACGLPWEDNCLDFHQNKRAVMTSSNTQVRQKIYTSSLQKWKAFEEYLPPLVALEQELATTGPEQPQTG